jgi:hypothetical protein
MKVAHTICFIFISVCFSINHIQTNLTVQLVVITFIKRFRARNSDISYYYKVNFSCLELYFSTLHLKYWRFIKRAKEIHFCTVLEVLTVVFMKSTIFWDMTACSLVKGFALPACFMLVSYLYYSSTMKMVMIWSFETSVEFHWTKRSYIPDERVL